MKIVEIFRTDILYTKDADKIIDFLLALYPTFKINIDLEDEENILRIEAYRNRIEINSIIQLVNDLGHYCERVE